MRTALRLGVLFAAVAVVIVVVSAVTVRQAPAAVPGSASVAALLRGIPQQGAWLGKKNAPIVLVEYVDLQCPFCAKFAMETFRPIVRSYVRTGRVRVLFRGLAFLGPDSVTTLRWTYAAGRQNKLWNMLEILFANQGGENSGWAKQSLLTGAARSIAGLDVSRLRHETAKVTPQMKAAAAAATAAKVPGTPYFQVGTSVMNLKPLPLHSFDASDFAAELDRLLR